MLKHMKRLLLLLLTFVLLFSNYPVISSAEEVEVLPEQLLISEVKVKNDSNGYNEFIELYNNGETEVDLSQFKLHYFNNPSPPLELLPTKILTLPTVILAPTNYFVLARNVSQIEGAVELTVITSLVDSGGILRLIGPDDEAETTKVYDEIIWKDILPPPGGYVVPASTMSLQRAVDEEGMFVSEDPQWIAAESTPFSHVSPPETEHPEEVPSEETPPEETPPVNPPSENNEPQVPPVENIPPPSNLLPIQITELLPNPISPQTDSLDEFVELYNPNTEPIDLNGYTLQTGANYTYRYVIADLTIEPGGYVIFTSGNTNLALANSAGAARLLDQTGAVISEITSYSDAPDGQSWIFMSGSWQWSTTPTPGAQNVVTVPEPKVTKAASITKTTAKKTPVKAKKAVAKTAAKKSTKASTIPERAVYQDPASTNQVTPLHPTILVGVSLLAILYGAYEYRQDMANRLYQLRRYREARREARTKP